MARPTKHGKRWRIRWLDENGVRRSQVFDSYKEADFQLNKKQSEVVEVQRGLRSPEPKPCTFPQLTRYYLQYRTNLKRYQRGDKLNIKNHLLPFFKEIPLDQVEAHIDRYKLDKSHLSPKTVHNHLTLLISMLHVAHCQKWVREVPRIKKPRVKVADKDFRYLRTQDEIDRFLAAAEALDPAAFVYFDHSSPHGWLKRARIAA